MKYLTCLGALDWANFPERDPHRAWPGPVPHPRAAYVAAFLVKLQEKKVYMADLRAYLVEHPALVWLLGFQLVPSDQFPWGFDVEASVPTRQHFSRVLRELPNAGLQFLLDRTVQLIEAELPDEIILGQTVTIDIKHVLAWVAENNPKAYIKESERLNKERQPSGDPDCKLGCKKKANRSPGQDEIQDGSAAQPVPHQHPIPTNFSPQDVYYWGYGSGAATTKVPDLGEVVLAEFTQPFNRGETTYFFPLMGDTERRLNRHPTFGALDRAFDAFYVYQYFHQAAGFAAVPFVPHGGFKNRQFDPDGLPLCQAGFPMPLKATFIKHSTEVEHECGRYACPLFCPEPTPQPCPINHPNFAQGGCLTTMPTCDGARIRYQLDRDSDLFKEIYQQRTACERINSQAEALGIERPKLRRGSAIANQNTLIYVLINLRTLHRLRHRLARAD
jgi:hypothetical protein